MAYLDREMVGTSAEAKTAANTPSLGKPRPFVGHFPAYGRDPLGFVTRVANEVGGVVPIRMGPMPGLMISDPAAIEEVLVTRNKDFRKSLATRRVSVVTGNGILVSNGETWREHRRAVQPAFHSDRIRAWAERHDPGDARHGRLVAGRRRLSTSTTTCTS